MERGEDGFTLLEVVLLLCFSVVIIIPSYSYMMNMARLKQESSDERRDTNSLYEAVEEIKLYETDSLIEGVEINSGVYTVRAFGEYDQRLEEDRALKERKGKALFDYRKLDIEIRVYREKEYYAEFDVMRVEAVEEEDGVEVLE